MLVTREYGQALEPGSASAAPAVSVERKRCRVLPNSALAPCQTSTSRYATVGPPLPSGILDMEVREEYWQMVPPERLGADCNVYLYFLTVTVPIASAVRIHGLAGGRVDRDLAHFDGAHL